MPGYEKDKYPNFFKMDVVESALNTYTEKHYSTNIPDGYVMNVIKVWAVSANPSVVDEDATAVKWQIATSPQTDVERLSAAGIWWRDVKDVEVFDSGATDGTVAITKAQSNVNCYDFSDGQGHGRLLAAADLYLGVVSDANTAVKWADVWLEYTLVKVPAAELLQLVRRDN